LCVAKFLCVRNLKPESDLKYFLVAIRLLENKENVHSIEINKIINAFLSASKLPPLQVALFLSFVLVVNYPDLKPQFVINSSKSSRFSDNYLCAVMFYFL